jgi:exodeoxyribonuclease VII large subunit
MHGQYLEHLRARLQRAAPQRLQTLTLGLDGLQARLAALDPQRVLERGYAWLDDGQGGALSSVAQLSEGQDLRAVLADGEARMQVLATMPKMRGA